MSSTKSIAESDSVGDHSMTSDTKLDLSDNIRQSDVKLKLKAIHLPRLKENA